MSFGYVNPKSGAAGSGGKTAAVVRGPIATKIINQLLLNTEWGQLDYLVISDGFISSFVLF
jgi:Mrp family chromosome partitioning ATPase